MFDLLVFFLSEFLEPYPLCLSLGRTFLSNLMFNAKSFFFVRLCCPSICDDDREIFFFVDFQSRFSYQGFFPLGYSLMVVTKLTAPMFNVFGYFFLFTSLEQYAHQILIYSESFYFIWWLKFKIVHRLCVCGESFFWFISVFFFCHRFFKMAFFSCAQHQLIYIDSIRSTEKNDFFFPGWI